VFPNLMWSLSFFVSDSHIGLMSTPAVALMTGPIGLWLSLRATAVALASPLARNFRARK
jgi:hypothetical protein